MKFVAELKKFQGNVGKVIGTNHIMKTLKDWDMSQSAAQVKYYPSFQVIQQTGTIACELEIETTAWEMRQFPGLFHPF